MIIAWTTATTTEAGFLWLAPQNPRPTPTPNRNCITNAVRGATGLARPFGNVGPTGTIGHDGIHVVAPAGSRVTTLAPLVGTVLRIHDADEGKTHIWTSFWIRVDLLLYTKISSRLVSDQDSISASDPRLVPSAPTKAEVYTLPS